MTLVSKSHTHQITHTHSFPKLFTRDGKVKFHPKSVNCDETEFDSKYMIYHTRVKSSAVFIHDSSLIPPFPLLFFGGDITVRRDTDQDTIAVDDWIVFQASRHIAELVKVRGEEGGPNELWRVFVMILT